MADQLATPEDLAALLQKDLDRSTTELLIECATAVVQECCGQRLVRGTSTISLLPTHGQWLMLPERPVVSVDDVTLGVEALVADTDYALVGHDIYRPYGWRVLGSPFATITVTYTHGYLADDQALQLARTAVLGLASAAYSNPTGATREQLGDYAVAYEAAASQMAAVPFLRAALLRQYGRPAGSIPIGSFG